MPEKDRRYKLNPFTGKFDRSLLPTDEGTAAGVDGQVQFNDDGALGGDSGLTYDKDSDTLTVVGFIKLPSAPVSDADAANKKYVDDAIANSSSDGFVYTNIQAGEEVTIPVRRQMAVHGELIIEGDLIIEGELVIEE